jgi:hypothetical protein
MRPLLKSLVLSLSLAVPAYGQSPAYAPATELPNGKEILVVYFGAQDCGPCHLPEVKDAVRKMKGLVQAQATKAGASTEIIAVANDWDHAQALDFLKDVQPFDQVVIGGNWANLATERFMWRDSTSKPAMPQVMVFERTVKPGRRITFTEPVLLRRLVGAKEIPDWVSAGAPISSKR